MSQDMQTSSENTYKRDMFEDLADRWYELSIKRLTKCFFDRPTESYTMAQEIKKTIDTIGVTDEQRHIMLRNITALSLGLRNKKGPSTRWSFCYFGYTEEYLANLKRKVEDLGIYIRFQRYTLNTQYPNSVSIGIHEPYGDQPRLYGYILTDRLYHGFEIQDLLEMTNYKMTCTMSVREHDDGLDEWYGDSKLHDEQRS